MGTEAIQEGKKARIRRTDRVALILFLWSAAALSFGSGCFLFENGYIRVFNNNADGSDDGDYLKGSCILTCKVGSSEELVLYPKLPSQRFYTKHGGKVQRLENGNLLITEARRGKVFEVI